MSVPKEITALVEKFHEHVDAYKSGRYNETQVRREFVDPFFTALGWDVDNTAGYAEGYKDVVHEDAIKVGGSTKAPDYSFRIGGVRKFFVETKKPSVNVKGDPVPAYQLRRYAWSAKLPLSIVTDFEEFAVYDCRIRPKPTDKASKDRTLYLTYRDYEARWDEIIGIFSREAILKGSFDKYAASKKKRGTAEVDDEFLKEIERWREELAKNLARRNKELGQREINFAVQKTIDRIIFLRICEDRGIEQVDQLRGLTNGKTIYPRLCQLFRAADQKYNSGLFYFEQESGRDEEPDEWTLELNIDDKTLKDIIRHLYYPDSPYEFSVLPADILGQVYERFLGKVIRLTPSHQAKVEEKPEVRKAGGVYYTPTYIVDYIVENTLGKLLEDKTPQEIAARTKTWKPATGKRPLSVLDPACGSGSFLIGAYQFLLDWYLKWYSNNEPEEYCKGKEPRIYEVTGDAASGGYRLTTTEKKRILLDHIYGVDIDPQAVEVTKLSLLLKVLEGETGETLKRSLFAKDRALPDLSSNIKCGNSLIGPDFWRDQQMDLFDEEERLRINTFDWPAEFKHIFQGDNPGFDAVIGNPPYVRMEEFKSIKEYLRQKYASHDERSDLYVYFTEREHQLLRGGGVFGKIISNKFIRANYGRPLRGYLNSVAHIECIVDFAGLPVFRGATVRTIVLITVKDNGNAETQYAPPPSKDEFLAIESGSRTVSEVVESLCYSIPQNRLDERGWHLIRPEYAALLDRLKHVGESLNAIMDGRICMGIKSGLTKAFVITGQRRRAILEQNPQAEEIIFPFLQGRNIRRYEIEPNDQFLIYTQHGIDMTPYPAVLEHLRPFRKRLEKRATRQNWYELQQPQYAYFDFFRCPKIVFPDIATTCRFALDSEGFFGANTVYFLPTDDLALLALLNSRLALFYFLQICAALEGPGESYLRFFGQYLEGFPVCLTCAPLATRDRLASLADEMGTLNLGVSATRTTHQKTALQRQITATDAEINRLVYELYGLSDDEIRLVEEATS